MDQEYKNEEMKNEEMRVNEHHDIRCVRYRVQMMQEMQEYERMIPRYHSYKDLFIDKYR